MSVEFKPYERDTTAQMLLEHIGGLGTYEEAIEVGLQEFLDNHPNLPDATIDAIDFIAPASRHPEFAAEGKPIDGDPNQVLLHKLCLPFAMDVYLRTPSQSGIVKITFSFCFDAEDEPPFKTKIEVHG